MSKPLVAGGRLRRRSVRAAVTRRSLRRRSVRAALALAVFLVLACLGTLTSVASAPASAASGTLAMCGNAGPAPTISHVVVVMMENRSYSQVVGSSNAPYETALSKQCGNATASFGATHTSAANYLATSAGEYPSTSPPGCGSLSACADPSGNLYTELSSAGLSWGAFIESMPSPCDPSAAPGYKIGHNPVIFYTGITASQCVANDVGVANLDAQSGAFWNDLQGGSLPAFSWVTPNEADDGEGSGTSAQNEQAADAWLEGFVALVEQSNSYQAGNTLVLVTYDEGEASDAKTGEDCTNESLDLPIVGNLSAHQESCHVPLFAIYPYTPAGEADGTFFDHYSITKTVEDIFGLPYLAHAADSQTNSLVGQFGIAAAGSSQPSVQITQPAAGATVSGSLTVSGTVNDANTVEQVEVGVDGGPAETATGTTDWSAAVDTTLLSNGPHTIGVTATDSAGDTATASETVTVDNSGATTSCPASPPGMNELSGNLSLEASQTGWTGVYNSHSLVSRVEPPGGSYDGLWALEVGTRSGDSGTAGVNNAAPLWVPGSPGVSTTAGAVYTGSAFVEASVAGETVGLTVRETAPDGAGVGYHTARVTLPDTGWHQISSSYTASGSGDSIRYSLYASNFASSAQSLLADCLSLQTPAS